MSLVKQFRSHSQAEGYSGTTAASSRHGCGEGERWVGRAQVVRTVAPDGPAQALDAAPSTAGASGGVISTRCYAPFRTELWPCRTRRRSVCVHHSPAGGLATSLGWIRTGDPRLRRAPGALRLFASSPLLSLRPAETLAGPSPCPDGPLAGAAHSAIESIALSPGGNLAPICDDRALPGVGSRRSSRLGGATSGSG